MSVGAVHPWKDFASAAAPRAKASPRSCSYCGKVGHDRRNHGAVTGEPIPVAAGAVVVPEPARWTAPADDTTAAAAASPDFVDNLRRRTTTTPHGRTRSKTIAANHVSRAERRSLALVVYPDDVARPITRGDCASMPRPCPFVSCSHHLYLEVDRGSGALKLNFPHLEVWELAETCSLDVADRSGITLEEAGAITNITRERVRQLEVQGLEKIRRADPEMAKPDRAGDAAPVGRSWRQGFPGAP